MALLRRWATEAPRRLRGTIAVLLVLSMLSVLVAAVLSSTGGTSVLRVTSSAVPPYAPQAPQYSVQSLIYVPLGVLLALIVAVLLVIAARRRRRASVREWEGGNLPPGARQSAPGEQPSGAESESLPSQPDNDPIQSTVAAVVAELEKINLELKKAAGGQRTSEPKDKEE